ncbi:MAG: SUMF1/EgtB/PvdO family nonheme iron enzyme [Chloroflexi bacterium]|nr:SUMF1/EgtB/PvdO family nonheme iron enzyme [Chloroflexota bacterium]
MNEQEQLQAELEKLEQAIAAQEALRGILDDEQIKTMLSQLREKQSVLLAALSGSGAIAQGEGAKAAGEGAVIARDVVGHVITGDNVVITELPQAVLELFARQFGFDHTADDAGALRAYFNNVVFEKHSKLSFLFIRPETGKVYTEADIETVFVPLRITDPEATARQFRVSRQLERFDRMPDEMTEAVQPVTLPEILSKYPCVLLRGKPGCGKTTLLRHVALSFARGEHREKLGWEGPAPLPLLVPLRNFGAFLKAQDREGRYVDPQPRALLEYLEEHLRGADVRFSPDFLRKRLDTGQCFLLLDALDEASGVLNGGGDLRTAVARQVAAFIRRYKPKGNRFALTSRPRAYQEGSAIRQALPQPQVCDVLDMDPDGYRRLITNLLTVLTGSADTGRAEAQDLLDCITPNRQLADLAGNPLLCTTLVLVYKYRGRKLPERRVDVLHEIVTLLLGRWEEERRDVFSPGELARLGTREQSTEQAIQFRRRALVSLAWQMQQDFAPEVPAHDAVQTLARFYCDEERADEHTAEKWAREFLDVMHERSGLFIAIDEGLHTFSHQAFREYLAATYLVNKRESYLLKEVLHHAPAPDEWWEQVLLLAGAHPELSSGAAGLLIERLLEPKDMEYAHLAARCAQDMTDKLPGVQRKRLQDFSMEAMRSETRPAQERALAGRALALAGDPRFRADAWHLPDEPALSAAEGPMLGFVEIPAGKFLMGSNKQQDDMAYGNEQPQHPVELSAYYIARYPVTVAQFDAFVGDGGYGVTYYWTEAAAAGFWDGAKFKGPDDDEPRDRPVDYGAPFNLPNHPAVGVTWYEALAYCRWLTEQLRENTQTESVVTRLLRDGWKVTLPSETEWEKAASWSERGKRRYSWGDNPDPERANYKDTSIGTTSTVGCFPGGTSPYGIEDLSGNVWEWTRSCYKSYPYTSTDGREDLGAGPNASRVLRGGSFLYLNRYVRCACRIDFDPHLRYSSIGFRLVVVSPLPPDSDDSGL